MNKIMLVWNLGKSEKDKTYFVTFEWKDYEKSYVARLPVGKSFLTNLIAQIAILEEKGYTYDSPFPTQFLMEGLPP